MGDAWSLIRTVDQGRVFVELCRAGKSLVEDVAARARGLVAVADSDPSGEEAVKRCAEAAYQGTRDLRPLLLDLLSIHRTAVAVGLMGADAAAEAVPDGLEVDLRIAAEAVRSTVELHHPVDEEKPAFNQALEIWRLCAQRIVIYADRFGTLACSPQSEEPIYWHRRREQREKMHLD